uniref:NARG2_C domain-containing protein n=1 Tax=Rhodnius prolixus TaxID=13249 RepID=T1HUA0_RHOPR
MAFNVPEFKSGSEGIDEDEEALEVELRKKRNKHFFLNDADFDDWWSSLDSRVEKKSFGEQEEDIFKYSVILKSFRNEYETDSLLTGKSLKLLFDGQIDLNKKEALPDLQKRSIEVLVPGYNQNSFIPNTSCLTFSEMVTCHAVIEAGSAQNQEQFNIWQICKPKLEEEQLQYIEFAREQWIDGDCKRHAVLLPHVKDLVDLYWKVRLERVYLCPKFYIQKEIISLASTSLEEVELKFVKQLESIGRPAKYYIPDLWTFVVNVNTVANSIIKPEVGWSQQAGNAQYYKQLHPKLLEKGYHSDVSKDNTAIKLAKENAVNIVLSSSAFSYLVDNQAAGINSTWSLPITVIEYQTDHGAKKIAFIDKKLPPLAMTAVDRNKYYAKLALKKLLIKVPQNYSRFYFYQFTLFLFYCNLRDPAAGIYDADSVETFGVDSPKKKLKYRNLHKKIKKRCYYCELKETANTKQEDVLPKIETLQMQEDNVSKSGEISDSDDSISLSIDLGEENTDKIENGELNNEEKLEKDQEISVSSELSNSQLPTGTCCCTYEWIEDQSENTEFNKEPVQKPYKLSPKLEYQTEFGAEAATLNEILREWASLYIRPSTTLARVRIDAVKGELIQIQHLTTAELTVECQRLHKFNPRDRLPTVHSILVKISDLPAGTYVLSHKPKNGTFVDLCKSVESGGGHSYNLHLSYNMVDPTVVAPQRSPFRPLDPAVITPTFKYFKRAPCTFAPKKYKSKRSLLKDNT